MTVLFADVVRSMDIAATVGAERLREIMTELVTHAAAVVRRYGGTVDKFTGDAIMAVFGAPAALEDHALRACLAALGIQEEVTRLAAGVKRLDDVDLHLRVGLNSGQVIAGEIGSAALGYTAIGEQGADGDVAQAEAAINRLAAASADDGLAVRDILLLRLRALVAWAHGDAPAYANFWDRYRDMARTLGFEGHVDLADAMP